MRVTDETVKVCAYNFPQRGLSSGKSGDYWEHVTHYLVVGSASHDHIKQSNSHKSHLNR